MARFNYRYLQEFFALTQVQAGIEATRLYPVGVSVYEYVEFYLQSQHP